MWDLLDDPEDPDAWVEDVEDEDDSTYQPSMDVSSWHPTSQQARHISRDAVNLRFDATQPRIDYAFLNDFEFYLRTEKSCNNNSAVKYLKNFGKIIRICLANGWLDKDPYLNYQSKFNEVTRVFLNEDELENLSTKNFKNERLSLVRDIFLFSCYTGLAYIDTQKLTHQNINLGLDGNKWIFTKRQKTKTTSNIPLLPQAESIVEKYKDNKTCLNSGKLLPVLSNQKMNAYLKELGYGE